LSNALFPREFGPALTREDAAKPATKKSSDLNHPLLALDLCLQQKGIGLSEIGRAAEHRHGKMVLLERGLDLVEKGLIVFHKARVEFEAVDAECCGKLDPLENSHSAMDAQLIHVAFRECG
jgi:hypothetical protein